MRHELKLWLADKLLWWAFKLDPSRLLASQSDGTYVVVDTSEVGAMEQAAILRRLQSFEAEAMRR